MLERGVPSSSPKQTSPPLSQAASVISNEQQQQQQQQQQILFPREGEKQQDGRPDGTDQTKTNDADPRAEKSRDYWTGQDRLGISVRNPPNLGEQASSFTDATFIHPVCPVSAGLRPPKGQEVL
ncbi:hypothetical protein CMUS01_01961 [Colletotrichum musicola]|uniref:Uncharacterized protein n=1 Tax=Colletotrichum musicola TaxID=2175873 RepID=A0A8H6U7J6_9PEZI|nr:hypothetical protein CMUS01_01961 [Colletotrichum musicola]